MKPNGRHYAVVTSRRLGLFMCPICGHLGPIEVAIRHNIAHQWTQGQEYPQPVQEPVHA